MENLAIYLPTVTAVSSTTGSEFSSISSISRSETPLQAVLIKILILTLSREERTFYELFMCFHCPTEGSLLQLVRLYVFIFQISGHLNSWLNEKCPDTNENGPMQKLRLGSFRLIDILPILCDLMCLFMVK